MVQGLRLCASNAEGTGSMSDQRIKIPHPEQCSQKKKNTVECSTKTIYVTFIKKQKSTVRPKKAFSPSLSTWKTTLLGLPE